ncbi:MAG: hypothetical protein ACREF7_00520 [Candidatus Saccharimonadales bacterium]
MSSDNFYLIRKHPAGGYTATMGFASSERKPRARKTDFAFKTVAEAVTYALGEYTEYGVSVDPECE